jgi:hypothetical protein
MRSRIPRELIEQHFGRALVLAMSLAESAEAAALPGWRRHPELPSRPLRSRIERGWTGERAP